MSGPAVARSARAADGPSATQPGYGRGRATASAPLAGACIPTKPDAAGSSVDAPAPLVDDPTPQVAASAPRIDAPPSRIDGRVPPADAPSAVAPSVDLVALAPGASLLRRFAAPIDALLWEGVQAVTAGAPFRHLQTPGGFTMAVAMTNCGALGWVSDRHGYRYTPVDPDSGLPWPALPEALRALAVRAASAAGFDDFEPDACLVNRYVPGARLSLHRDADERDFAQPIVSVSLGLPATFLFGGTKRSDATLRVPLEHGDVVVWGGVARMRYHGVLALKDGVDPLLGRQRINLTFRKAG